LSRRAQFSERKAVQGWRGAILRGYQGRKPAGCACPANICPRRVLFPMAVERQPLTAKNSGDCQDWCNARLGPRSAQLSTLGVAGRERPAGRMP